jgi:hypothetical protein
MASDALALPALEPAHKARDMPEGPVSLFLAVFSDDGRPMGVAPAAEPRWCWRNGAAHLDYGPVRVDIREAGRYACGYLVAVSGQWWRPVLRVNFNDDVHGLLRPGDWMTVTDAVIRLDFSGGPNDPALPPG